MSRTAAPHALSPLAVIALAVALAAGCGDDAPPPPEKPPEAPKTEDELIAKGERTLAAAKKKIDEDARALLASFESRSYDPRRDGRIVRAAGTMLVKAGGKEATYRFAFDAANPQEKPVTTEPVSEPDGWNPELARRARTWALQACIGSFSAVAFYRPPAQLSLIPSIDKKNLVVTAPPFRGPLSVSYSFDDRQIVTIRGEWTNDKHRAVTRYEWDDYRGRYMLRRETVHEGAVTDFEYDDRRGLPLLRKVTLTNGGEVVNAELTFETVEQRSE